MPEIKLLALDLDGTLLTAEKILAVDGVALLKQVYRMGLYIILATMRSPFEVRSFCQELQIHDPLICANGAWVLASPDGPDWAYQTIPLETAFRLAHFAEANSIELVTTTGSITYYRQRPGQSLGMFKPNKKIVETNYDALVAEPLRILVFETDQADKIGAFCRSELGDFCQSEVFLNPDGSFQSLAISPRGADKCTGLKVVLNHLKIPTEQVMAVGDNYVDIPMFRLAGLSVAMGNAPWEVKQTARVIAPSNNEEGVAWAIKKFILNKENVLC